MVIIYQGWEYDLLELFAKPGLGRPKTEVGPRLQPTQKRSEKTDWNLVDITMLGLSALAYLFTIVRNRPWGIKNTWNGWESSLFISSKILLFGVLYLKWLLMCMAQIWQCIPERETSCFYSFMSATSIWYLITVMKRRQ